MSHNTHSELRATLKSTHASLQLRDERGKMMSFPMRKDYIEQLINHGLIASEHGFVADDYLIKEVYLDWLSRRQVGCIFAQLLARHRNRASMRTSVLRSSSAISDPREKAIRINSLVVDCVNDTSNESLTVLLPDIVDIQELALLVWELSQLPRWKIEKEQLWRGSLVRIGLRVEIGEDTFAEILGMGSFGVFPTTRQCPLTTLEIRTKVKRARKSKVSTRNLASHLADIPVEHILTPEGITLRSNVYTPALRKRVLGGEEDERAKAAVTYSIPAAIWFQLKPIDS